MAYIKGENRHQTTLFPDCIDYYVGEDSPVRLFDAFVDSLDMVALGFQRSVPNEDGRPPYDPRDLLRLYLYGYFYSVRSSRRLARECKVNIEVMWLLCKLTPDFRTIADFRKDNVKSITKVFKEFNRFCNGLSLFSKSFISIDGSKFKAVNAKDNNFTLNKLDDRIRRLDEHIALYMEELDACDESDNRKLSREELQHKLEVCQDRKAKYEGYRQHLEESGEKQISTTDPDSRLMKQNEGFGVCYNVQTAVDAESHMIAGFKVTNCPTDHGQITGLASEVKADYGVDILEATADKGYECPEDIANALAAGVVPSVIRRDGGDTTEVVYEYSEAEITEEMRNSTSPEDIKRCLESGVIPEVYKDVLSDATIAEQKVYEASEESSAVLKMSDQEMQDKAHEGYFVRDPQRNFVYCPECCILRPKSIKRNGEIRYCNKLACKKCQNKCTTAEWKEADFNKDTLIRPAKRTAKASGDNKSSGYGNRRKAKVRKVAKFTLHLDQKKMEQRKCLSEHPFGTVKRALNSGYYLLKTLAKTEAETALAFLAYNMRRAITMCGVDVLVAKLA